MIKNMQEFLVFVWRKSKFEEREIGGSFEFSDLKWFCSADRIRVLVFISLANHTENQISHPLIMISEI
jgi:hypothetical protein